MFSSKQRCIKKQGIGAVRPSPFVISITAVLAIVMLSNITACDSQVSEPKSPASRVSNPIFGSVPLSANRSVESANLITSASLQNVGDPTPELVALEPLGRSAFPHHLDAKFKFKYDNRMEIVQMDNVSDIIAAKITIQEGGSAGWHIHPGSAFGVVVSGTFGIIEETDCVPRTYNAGEAFFHRGQGIVDVGFNAGEGDVVVYLTFMGVPPGSGPTLPYTGENPCPL